MADRFLKQAGQDKVELIAVGKKAVEYYCRRKWTIKKRVPEWGGKITFQQTRNLTHELVDWFISGELDEIRLVYTHFISIPTRKVVLEKFLNIERPKTEDKKIITDYIFEPNPAEIYSEILPRYCVTKVQTLLAEAFASELAARMISMGAATKNAEEMIENLTLVRNKVRQASITKEMLEITSGAEALK